MKKIPNWHRNTGCPVQILFMAGFLIGMILPDIAWKMEWHQKTISAMYLLRSFAAGSEAGVEYFLQVLGMRGSVYLLGAACGISVFGVPFAVAGSMYLGLVGYLHPDMYLQKQSVLFVTMMLFGGSASLAGPVIGAISIEVLLEGLRTFEEYQMLIYGVLLLIVIVAMPGGLVGAARDIKASFLRRKALKQAGKEGE